MGCASRCNVYRDGRTGGRAGQTTCLRPVHNSQIEAFPLPAATLQRHAAASLGRPAVIGPRSAACSYKELCRLLELAKTGPILGRITMQSLRCRLLLRMWRGLSLSVCLLILTTVSCAKNGPRVWNGFTATIIQITSYGHFRQHLKTHSFGA